MRGKVDREYTLAQVAEMRRKNQQLMAPQYDAHVCEYGKFDPDLLAVGVLAPRLSVKAHMQNQLAAMVSTQTRGRGRKPSSRPPSPDGKLYFPKRPHRHAWQVAADQEVRDILRRLSRLGEVRK